MSLKKLVSSMSRMSLQEAVLVSGISRLRCAKMLEFGFHSSGFTYGKQKFIKLGIDLSKYSLRPLPLPKTGGRGADGKVQTHGVGGGHKQRYRRVDFVRSGPADGEPFTERITEVRYDPCRSANIAVAASGDRKRYIIATENMKPGDLIETYGGIPRIAVRPKEGNAYPVGALPLGTIVHNVEKFVGQGASFARSAGSSAVLLRKVGDRCIVKLPSKREINIAEQCMVTVGRVSNVNHNKEIIGSAGRARWFGIRPQSGWRHRKTGYNGRKIRPVPPMVNYNKPPSEKLTVYRFTV